MNILIQIICSNTAIAAIIAILAILAARIIKKPELTHALWLLVFIKLITPPLVNLPLIDLSRVNLPYVNLPLIQSVTTHTPHPIINTTEKTTALAPSQIINTRANILLNHTTEKTTRVPTQETAKTTSLATQIQSVLLLIATLGSLIILVLSTCRIYKFDRLIKASQTPAPPHIQKTTRQLAAQFNLKKAPKIYTTTASIPPLVWSILQTKIILPQTLITQLPHEQLKLIIAHEIAHIARKDHLVRWIEWLTFIVLWFNPLTWIARKNLRTHEEICCDTLVIQTLNTIPKTYASALLNAIQYLACPVHPAPTVASQLNSGKSLKQRLTMIIKSPQSNKKSTTLKFLTYLTAAAFLPIGLANAHDPNPQPENKKPHTQIHNHTTTKTTQQQIAEARIELDKLKSLISSNPNSRKQLSDTLRKQRPLLLKILLDSEQLTPQQAEEKLKLVEEIINGIAANGVSTNTEEMLKKIVANETSANNNGHHTIIASNKKNINLKSNIVKTDKQLNAVIRKHYSAVLKSLVDTKRLSPQEAKRLLNKITANEHSKNGKAIHINLSNSGRYTIDTGKYIEGKNLDEAQIIEFLDLNSHAHHVIGTGQVIEGINFDEAQIIKLFNQNSNGHAQHVIGTGRVIEGINIDNAKVRELIKQAKQNGNSKSTTTIRLSINGKNIDLPFENINQNLNPKFEEQLQSLNIKLDQKTISLIEKQIKDAMDVMNTTKAKHSPQHHIQPVHPHAGVRVQPHAPVSAGAYRVPGARVVKENNIHAKAWAKLQSQVKAGEITLNQANKRMEIIKQYTQK